MFACHAMPEDIAQKEAHHALTAKLDAGLQMENLHAPSANEEHGEILKVLHQEEKDAAKNVT